MRNITVRALWACADVLEIVRDGLIVLASRTVGGSTLGEESPRFDNLPMPEDGYVGRKAW